MGKETVVNNIAVTLEKLDVNKDDVIVVKIPENTNSDTMKSILQQMEEQQLPSNVTVLCIRESVSIETLDEYQMNKLGWFKFDPDHIN